MPCRLLRIRVRMGLAGDVSIVEQFVLRAIRSGGATTVTELTNTLELSPRIITDCLGDLWRAGHVHLDFLDDRESITLTEETERQVSAGDVGAIRSTYETSDVREMAFDSLVGRIVPTRATSRRVPHNVRVPRMPDDPGPLDLGAAALAAAVERDLTRWIDGGDVVTTEGALRVLDAYLDPEQVRETVTAGYVPLVVSVVEDADLGLRVTATDQLLTRAERDRATRRLQRLIDDDPRGSFVRALAGLATAAPSVAVAPLLALVSALRKQVSTLPEVVTGTRQHEHDRMRLAFYDVVHQASRAWTAQTEVVLVDSPQDHEQVVGRLIDGAMTQVVLCATWLRYNGVSRFLPHLERAIDRGVQVVLLWGARVDDTLDQPIINAVHNLQRRGGPAADRVLVKTRVPAQVNARLVVSDDRQALVTSHDFLGGGTNSDLGLLVSAVRDHRSEIVESLLSWTCTLFPDLDLAQAIIRDNAAFGRRSEPAVLAADIAVPAFHSSLDAGSPASAQVAIWAGAWAAAVEELARLVEDLPATASTVTDAEHQVLLRRALDTAERHVLVAAPRLSGRVVDATILTAITTCLQRGADVTIVYGDLADDSRSARTALMKLSRPREPGLGRLELMHDHNNRARVLLWDDEVALGSFDHLSHSGHRSGRSRHRNRGELSLRVTNPSLAATMLTTFGVFPPVAGMATAINRSSVASGDLVLAQAALEVLAKPGERLVGGRLAALAARGTTATAVLDALEHVGASAGDQERLCAAVLLAGTDVPVPWWQRLLELVWMRHDFLAALAIRAVVDDDGVRPRRALVRAAAAWAAGDSSEQLMNAAIEDGLDGAERDALATVAVSDLVLRGHVAAHEVLDSWSPQLEGDVGELARAALALSRAASAPLPVSRLRAAAAAARTQEEADTAWEVLHGALQRLRNFPPGFISGDLLKTWAFGDGGPLAQLELLAHGHDVEGVGRWRAAQVTSDPHGWLAWCADRAGAREIVGNRRTSMVAKVAAILGAVNNVAEIGGSTQPTGESPEVGQFLAKAGPLITKLAIRAPDSINGHLTQATARSMAAALEGIL